MDIPSPLYPDPKSGGGFHQTQLESVWKEWIGFPRRPNPYTDFTLDDCEVTKPVRDSRLPTDNNPLVCMKISREKRIRVIR
jgi:hypothetical protein